METKTIVVLSMHRTGSSLVANLLHNALDVKMGTKFLGKGPWNRQGVWEDIAFVSMNRRLMHAAGADKQTGWKHPPARDKILFLANSIPWKQGIKCLVQSHSGLWGWKDPRTCLTIELYHEWLENPYYVVTKRNREDTIRSLEKRGKRMGNTFWQKLIERYEQDRESFLSNVDAPRCTVCFEKLTDKRKWKQELELLAGFIGVESNIEKARGIIQWR